MTARERVMHPEIPSIQNTAQRAHSTESRYDNNLSYAEEDCPQDRLQLSYYVVQSITFDRTVSYPCSCPFP